jgi:tRNA/rRNA methyltransferase
MKACRVVLVRPHYAGNIGATARVMHNFGAQNLALVDPVADHRSDEARRLATHGEFILDQAAVCSNLMEAVADCRLCIATSAKTEGVVRETVADAPRDLIPRVALEMRGGPVAVVFGPEPSGLTTAEISRCHFLLSIPANPDFPSLNLAQAVAICLYELYLAREADKGGEKVHSTASFAEQERMFDHLENALKAVHFLYGAKADSLMHAVRHLIGRAKPTSVETKILHGLARQLEWASNNGPTPADEKDDLPNG